MRNWVWLNNVKCHNKPADCSHFVSRWDRWASCSLQLSPPSLVVIHCKTKRNWINLLEENLPRFSIATYLDVPTNCFFEIHSHPHKALCLCTNESGCFPWAWFGHHKVIFRKLTAVMLLFGRMKFFLLLFSRIFMFWMFCVRWNSLECMKFWCKLYLDQWKFQVVHRNRA